ncbi:MAG: hypothetical protein ACKVZH_18050 [Blastocatellia bacterium]
MSSLSSAGLFLQDQAITLLSLTRTTAKIVLLVAVALILIRVLVDKYDFNPFGRLIYYLCRPTNRWFYEVRSSPIYRPVKNALRFDPAGLLLLLAAAVMYFLVTDLVNDALTLLLCVGRTLVGFGTGAIAFAIKALIGTALLAVIYFLTALMTVLVIHSWFGLFDRWAYKAGQHIYPLIHKLDRNNRLGPFAFLIAFLLLGVLANIVLRAFF